MEAVARYHPGQDQREMIAGLSRPLDALLPFSRVHDGGGDDAASWMAFAGLGLFGIGLAEERGGLGLGASEETLLAQELGRRLASPSVFATMAAVHASAPRETVAAFMSGEARAAPAYVADGRTTKVAADGADHILLRDGDALSLHKAVPEGGSLDDRLWITALAEGRVGDAIVAFDDAALLRVRLIDAAALVGIALAALDMAVAYAMMREQFGRPIGGFQAIKHRCADMALAARGAADQATFAAVAIDGGRPDAQLQVECALLLAIRAAIGNAGANIQVHGGIGFSDEADPHLLLKRAHVLAMVAGGEEAAALRVAAAPRALEDD